MFEGANWFGLLVVTAWVTLMWLYGRWDSERAKCVQWEFCRENKPCRYHHDDGTIRRDRLSPYEVR